MLFIVVSYLCGSFLMNTSDGIAGPVPWPWRCAWTGGLSFARAVRARLADPSDARRLMHGGCAGSPRRGDVIPGCPPGARLCACGLMTRKGDPDRTGGGNNTLVYISDYSGVVCSPTTIVRCFRRQKVQCSIAWRRAGYSVHTDAQDADHRQQRPDGQAAEPSPREAAGCSRISEVPRAISTNINLCA